MARTRLLLSAGTAFLLLSCCTGFVLPTFLEPQPPWEDVDAQQAAWGRLLDVLMISACMLGAVGLALTARGYYRWRRSRLS
jgi:hypothetical protein